MTAELLEVGRVVRPHGLRGEVVVGLVSNRLERVAPGALLEARPPGAAPRPLVVRSSRPFQHRHLVVFDGVVDRDGAEALRDATLYGEAVEDPEALFVHDLIGSLVVEADGTERGRVSAVEANPASDLLVLDGGRFLVPLRFVVSSSPGRLVVEAPAGLFE